MARPLRHRQTHLATLCSMPFLAAYRIPRLSHYWPYGGVCADFVWSIVRRSLCATRCSSWQLEQCLLPESTDRRKRSLQLTDEKSVACSDRRVGSSRHNQFPGMELRPRLERVHTMVQGHGLPDHRSRRGCTPRELPAELRWRWLVLPIAAAWALHWLLNIALKDWRLLSLSAAMQAGTPIGTRDMVSDWNRLADTAPRRRHRA